MGVARFATRTALRAGSRTTRFGFKAALAIIFAPFVGAWRDHIPGIVEEHFRRSEPWARWPQWLSAAFWAALAVWSSTRFAGAWDWLVALALRFNLDFAPVAVWAVALTLWACLGVLRRLMAATGRGWYLGGTQGIGITIRSWSRRAWPSLMVAVSSISVLSIQNPPWGVLAVLGLAAALALREIVERRRLDSSWSWVHVALGVPETWRDRVRSMPVGWRWSEFAVNVPDAAKDKIGGIDDRLVTVRPRFEAHLRHSRNIGNHVVEFRRASRDTIGAREMSKAFADMVESVTPTGQSSESRPDEHVAQLRDGVSETRAKRIDHLAHEVLGLSLVQWDDGARVAYLARLDDVTRLERKRLAPHLPGAAHPWALDVLVEADPQGAITGVSLTRFPAITDPVKRRDTLLAAARTLWPAEDGYRWFVHDDPANDRATLALREDPLRHTTPHPGVPVECDPTAIRVGVREDGSSFTHPVLGCHTILIGSSGSGKGSVLWSLITGLIPGVHAGWVEIHGIDLKGGVEFGFGKRAFNSLAFTPDAALNVFRDGAERLRTRLDYMRENGHRLHRPTRKEPLIFIVLDEAGALATRLNKPEYDEAMDLLKEILSQGRAAGVSVFAALQDPRKEAFKVRDLFTRQLALRLKSADETVMAIGRSLWEAGAHCEEISPNQEGTGFSLSIDDTDTSMTRFRAYWVDDGQVKDFTADAPPPDFFLDDLEACMDDEPKASDSPEPETNVVDDDFSDPQPITVPPTVPEGDWWDVP